MAKQQVSSEANRFKDKINQNLQCFVNLNRRFSNINFKRSNKIKHWASYFKRISVFQKIKNPSNLRFKRAPPSWHEPPLIGHTLVACSGEVNLKKEWNNIKANLDCFNFFPRNLEAAMDVIPQLEVSIRFLISYWLHMFTFDITYALGPLRFSDK